MTPAQLQTLKTDIAANTATISFGGQNVPINELPPGPDASFEIAAWYNAVAAPPYKVYRTSVPMSEIMLNGFDWTRVDNLSVGKARIWDWMVNADPNSRAIDPSKPNIRAGINAVWVGTTPDLAVRAAVYAHCARDASRVEKLLKIAGAGAAPDANGDGPATLGFEGTISYQDVEAARNLP